MVGHDHNEADRRWPILLQAIAASACVVGALGCHTEDPTALPPGAVRGVAVTPQQVSLLTCTGASLLAVVDRSPGMDAAVRWTSSDSVVVAVNSNGDVYAWSPGTALVSARSVADTARADHATVSVFDPYSPIVIGAIYESGTRTLAALNALTDSIDVYATVSPPLCRHSPITWNSASVQLAGDRDTLSLTLPVPRRDSAQVLAFRINTSGASAVPNGVYKLGASVLGSDGRRYAGPSTDVTVANP